MNPEDQAPAEDTAPPEAKPEGKPAGRAPMSLWYNPESARPSQDAPGHQKRA